MLRAPVMARIGLLLSVCLLGLLVGPVNMAPQTAPQTAAQQKAIISECEGYSQQAAAASAQADADDTALENAKKNRRNLQTMLKGYAALLQSKPEESDETIKSILSILPKLTQASKDIKTATAKEENDSAAADNWLGKLDACFSRIQLTAGPAKAKATVNGIATMAVMLKVADKTETVNINVYSNGTYGIASQLRQGIKLPSKDPAASDTTGRETVDKGVTATVSVLSLVPGQEVWLGIAADTKTPTGPTLCSTTTTCSLTSGPYPGVRRGLGKGWAASEAVEVWLCRKEARCVGNGDPVAAININWVLP